MKLILLSMYSAQQRLYLHYKEDGSNWQLQKTQKGEYPMGEEKRKTSRT